MTALRVDVLGVRYGANRAVHGVSFAVERGEHVSLLGPSGCGKTTTLRAIAGLERPNAGRIAVDATTVFDAVSGVDVPPERRGLSMVFQSYAIWPHMSVFDNVAFSFRVRGIARRVAAPQIERALAMVGLASHADQPATRLSGGQQQRVALARAMAFETKLVLFDEPLSNLDAQLRLDMRAELADLRRRLGFTAVYVTHDQDEAFALSDRIAVMRAGRIEQIGRPDELYRAPATRFVAEFLGVKNIFSAEIGRTTARIASDVCLTAMPTEDTADARCVGFRPIDVRLTTGSGGGFPGVIRRATLGADLADYEIETGTLSIWARDRRRPDLAVGSPVRWSVAPEHCLILREPNEEPSA